MHLTFFLLTQFLIKVYSCIITYDDFCILFFIFGVDNSAHCGPRSNMGFCGAFHVAKFRTSLCKKNYPPDETPEPRLLCLKYYRAASGGWRDNGNCDVCVLEYQQTIRSYSGGRQPDDCSCHICRRQPPTLQDLASQFVFHLINIDRFELTADTTHRQYVQAVLAYRTKLENLLPPKFPSIWVWFQFHTF